MVRESFDDLPIYEIKDDRPLVDQRNGRAQCGHEGCILEAYHAGAYDDDFSRQSAQVGKVISIYDAMVIKGDLWAVRGSRAALNQNLRRFNSDPSAAALNFDGVRI
jgi:hypothetical protein